MSAARVLPAAWRGALVRPRVVAETHASVVFAARKRGAGPVIVKVSRDARAIEHEARMLDAAAGDGVARVVDATAGALMLEALDGPTLAERTARRRLTPEEIERLARRLADVLARLHERGIVHGDLKPENVILPRGSASRAALIDFDAARARGEPFGPRLSVAFAAPERLTGACPADPRADVFSLGATLWAASEGRSPFAAETRDEAVLRTLVEDPPAPDGVDRALADAVVAMLEKVPDRRPADGRVVFAHEEQEPASRASRGLADALRAALGLHDRPTLRAASAALARALAAPAMNEDALVVADLLRADDEVPRALWPLRADPTLLKARRREALARVQARLVERGFGPIGAAPDARVVVLGEDPLRAAWGRWREARAQLVDGELDRADALLDEADARLDEASGVVVVGIVRGLVEAARAEVRRWQGRHADAGAAARRALSRLPAGSVAWCEALGERATAAGRAADRGEVLAVAAALEGRAASGAATFAWDRACARTAVQLYYQGERRRATALTRLFEARTTEDGRPDAWRRELSPGALITRAFYDGRLDEYLRLLRAASSRFWAIGDVRSSCIYGASVGYAYAQLGDLARGERSLRQVLARAQASRTETMVTLARHNLGFVLACRPGKAAEALEHETLAIDALRAQGDLRLLAGSLAYRARALLARGDGAAERDALEAVALAERATAVRPLATAVLAEVRLAAGDLEGALELASRAWRDVPASAPPETGEAIAGLVRARALEGLGRVAAARRAAREAMARVRLRAARIGHRGWRARFLAGVPEHRALREMLARGRRVG